MNLKKFLSVVLTVAMMISSVSVFANADYPTACEITELTELKVKAVPAYDALNGRYNDEYAEDLALDFGVQFKALEEDAGEFANYIVDFELSFDKDVTAILAGQYNLFGENWVSVKSEEYTEDAVAGLNADIDGVEFKANRPIMIMFDSGLDDQFTYEEAVAIESFKCGIRYAYDVPNGVKANLALCVYPTVEVTADDDYDFVKDDAFYYIDRDSKIVVDSLSYTYNENVLGITELTTDADKVAALNANADTIATAADAAGAADLIAALDDEAKKDIAPEVIKALVEAAGEDVESSADLKVYGNAANGTVTVTVDDADAVEAAFANYDDVYEVTAECSVNGVVDTVDVPVLVAIPVADVNLVEKVLHLHDGVVEELDFIPGNGVIYIQMSKFSQIAVLSSTVLGADEAELKFVENTGAPRGEAWFDLVLSGASTEVVKGYLAGNFTLTPAGRAIPESYYLVAADDEISISYNALEDNARKYIVNLNSFNKDTSYTVVADGVTEITLAKLVVKAYGEGMINFSDVLLRRFDYDNEDKNLEENINVVKATGASYDIEVPTQDLTVEINFAHATETANEAAYQNMQVEIAKDGKVVDTIYLGSDNTAVNVATNNYSFTKTLLANTEYVVTISGLGYRTASYPINLGEEDRTLKFWNNYEDNAVEMEFVGTNAKGIKYNANFLAGDIVMDNYIDIYDLSAVVSYFGEKGLSATNNAQYSKYDLNRDGAIDSIDVAILLTSWNK